MADSDSPSLSGIAWVSLENEAAYTTTAAPFSAASGVISTADGGSYDMAKPTQVPDPPLTTASICPLVHMFSTYFPCHTFLSMRSLVLRVLSPFH